ncbi:MAG: hypothetical protein IIC51_09030 [Planctomycetes bacterium]|nr:hypothetical protein [Planctomycetota bacterium]
MGSFSDQLRSDANGQREAAALMVGKIVETPNTLKERLATAMNLGSSEAIRADVQRIIDSIESGTAEKRLITAIVGIVTANIKEDLADMADYFVASGALKRVSDKLRENRQLNHDLRMAVATGDDDAWNDVLERLAGRKPERGDDPGGEAEAGSQETAGDGGS